MAATNMVKAEAMMDHSAMSLFRISMDDLDKDGRDYFQLRRKYETDRIKRKMDSEKRVAEPQKADHDKLMKERAAEAQRGKEEGKQPRTTAVVAVMTPTPTSTVPIRSTSGPAPAFFGTPTSTPRSSMLPPTSPEQSPAPVDEQGDYWEDSICIPHTQQQPQVPSFEPHSVGSRNEIMESQEFGYRNFGRGLNLNDRFYAE